MMNLPLKTLCLCLSLTALSAGPVRAADKIGTGETSASAPLSHAGFAFGIADIARKGHIVTFTIPENARTLERRANAYVVSGLYALDREIDKRHCPVVQSHAVDDTVEHYSPGSGRARVKAVFEDEKTAKAAEEKGCLLINDPD